MAKDSCLAAGFSPIEEAKGLRGGASVLDITRAETFLRFVYLSCRPGISDRWSSCRGGAPAEMTPASEGSRAMWLVSNLILYLTRGNARTVQAGLVSVVDCLEFKYRLTI
jgi:hypothetical protein